MKSQSISVARLGSDAQRQIRAKLSDQIIATGRPAKYRNKRCEAWGIKFASQRERDRYGELLILQRAGKISELEAHPRYSLDVNGVHIGFYTADARYFPRGRGVIIEDVKSKPTMTTASRLRIRLFEAIYKCRVTLVQ